jgi:potassium channel subfamily K member 18
VDKIVNEMRSTTVERLWRITEDLNILYKENWTKLAAHEVIKFQDSLVHTLKTSEPAHVRGTAGSLVRSGPHTKHRWTFSSSFLYSLTLITTIGEYQTTTLKHPL